MLSFWYRRCSVGLVMSWICCKYILRPYFCGFFLFCQKLKKKHPCGKQMEFDLPTACTHRCSLEQSALRGHSTPRRNCDKLKIHTTILPSDNILQFTVYSHMNIRQIWQSFDQARRVYEFILSLLRCPMSYNVFLPLLLSDMHQFKLPVNCCVYIKCFTYLLILPPVWSRTQHTNHFHSPITTKMWCLRNCVRHTQNNYWTNIFWFSSAHIFEQKCKIVNLHCTQLTDADHATMHVWN